MKFKALRRYIENKVVCSEHVLETCELVIDGDSYFKGTYSDSGCQFVLGSDSDKYANYLKNKLSCFRTKDIKCHFIFSGAKEINLDTKKEMHQRFIKEFHDQAVSIKFFEPLFVKDIQKQVLEQLDMKYFVSEYTSTEAIVGVAKKFKCPVITNNVEYTLFGVSCIPPQSLVYDKNTSKLRCRIYEQEEIRTTIGVYSKTPILLALLNETGDNLNNLIQIIGKWDNDMDYTVQLVIRWVKGQREATIIRSISKSIDNNQYTAFKENLSNIQTLYLYPLCTLAVNYFQRQRAHGLFKDDKRWFAKGVSNGRIAPPFINLVKTGVFFGSMITNDFNRPDAMLVASDIIAYSQCLLTKSQSSTITIIQGKGTRSFIKEINRQWSGEIFKRGIFTKYRDGKKLKLFIDTDSFELFLKEVLPGYDYQLLQNVPQECQILVITLVYYISKHNLSFINAAYYILLSYLMLVPTSKQLDIQNLRLAISVPNTTDSVKFYNYLKYLFEKVNLTQKYDSDFVHSLSEFQHCLQFMNYLNKLCGEKIPCTIYHETFNATFIYNSYMSMKDRDNLIKFLEYKLEGSSVLKMYKNIISCFENLFSAVKK